MKTRISTICILAVLLFSGCAKEPVAPDTPDVPDTPTVGRHLRLGGSAGNDNAATRASWTDNNSKLTFAWEYSDPDATTSELKMAFTKTDGSYLKTIKGNPVADMRILRHSDSEKAGKSHWAEFEDIEGFDPTMPDSYYDGHTVHAVTPINDVNDSEANVTVGDDNKGTFTATLKMPTSFTQSGKNNLKHLSDYLYMYAESVLEGGTASLTFDHLAAYIRFKVQNKREDYAKLYTVKMEVVYAENKAAPASGISAAYTADGFTYTAAAAGTGIEVNTDGDRIDANEYIYLYAPVFPVGTVNPFQGKTLCFTLIADNPIEDSEDEYEYFTYKLSGETFKEVTESYDWKRGDLYTFHLYLDDVLEVAGVTVNDWTEQEINGGAAEENSSTDI